MSFWCWFTPFLNRWKRYPSGVFFYAFSDSLKMKNRSILPSLGSLKLHRRMLPLCVLLIAFAYLHLWPNVGSMFLSTEPSKACLIHKPCSTLPLHLDTFGPWRIFSKCHFPSCVPFPWESLCSMRLELVCLQHSILLCNVAFFYSFSKIIEKDKKNQIYPKKRKGKVFSFFLASQWVAIGKSTSFRFFFKLWDLIWP